MKVKPIRLRGVKSHYIHEDGYVFKIYNFKEIKIPIKVTSSIPRIRIGNQNYNMVFLMLEYFGETKYTHDEFINVRFKFKIIDGKIPFIHIKLIESKLQKIEDKRIYLYKCVEKATSANSRVSNNSTITAYDIFNSLLRTNFCCTYCNKRLIKSTWELDHVQPLSKNGFNHSTNITPSCKICNRMKSNIQIGEFIDICKRITNNFKDTYLLEDYEETIKNLKHNKKLKPLLNI